MGPEYYQQVEAYNVQHILYLGILTGAVLLVFYVLWWWCSDKDSIHDNNNRSRDKDGRLSMATVYAHEIEPGIVVLQSEQGDYFKILKEYDMNGETRNMYGSFSCTRPEVAQPKIHSTFERPKGNGSINVRQFPGQVQAPSAPLMLYSEDLGGATGTHFGGNVIGTN